MFKNTSGKGFHITFENGYTVSVQFGAGNYCDNYDALNYGEAADPSTTAEVAVWGTDGEFIELDGHGDVAGYQTPAQVLEIINLAASL